MTRKRTMLASVKSYLLTEDQHYMRQNFGFMAMMRNLRCSHYNRLGKCHKKPLFKLEANLFFIKEWSTTMNSCHKVRLLTRSFERRYTPQDMQLRENMTSSMQHELTSTLMVTPLQTVWCL